MSNSAPHPTWQVKDCDQDQVAVLAGYFDLHPAAARLLVARGAGDPAAAAAFLNPSLEQLHDPFLMPGMAAAVDRLLAARGGAEQVLIYGDYDVDGVCATVIVREALESLGIDVSHFIPHRVNDGYGLHRQVIEDAAAAGCNLMITVDTGITAVEPAQRAAEIGIDLIITDHHQPPADLPPAVAVVHPGLPGSSYPWPGLCGAGVALKLVQGLAVRAGLDDSFWRPALQLAALATVADIVALRDENRAIVALGLEDLRIKPRPGLAALYRTARVDAPNLSAWDISFALAPRLNAAGRMGDANVAVSLLRAGQADGAALADQLEALNQGRRAWQEKVYQAALARRDGGHVSEVVLLADPDWHPGVLGIVASRLAEDWSVPVLLAVDEGGMWRGSARSIAGFDITGALSRTADLLAAYGGHAQAAGFSLAAENADKLRRALSDQLAVAEDAGGPPVKADARLSIDEVTEGLVASLQQLEPFGEGNPAPLLASSAGVLQARAVGAAGEHLRLILGAPDSAAVTTAPLEAIAFRMGERLPAVREGGALEILFTPVIDTWQGRRRLQLRIEDLAPAALKAMPLDRAELMGLYRAVRILAGRQRGGADRFTWPDLLALARRHRPDLADPDRLELSLKVFHELELVERISDEPGSWCLMAAPGGGVDLEDSPTFRSWAAGS
ncbi:MAG: single-stranded-DNA-specific exonuclease RecJ [Thermaerobacterales bacterium]